RIDQGDDDQGSRADRVRTEGVRGAAHRRPGERPVFSRARRRAAGDGREPTIRRRLPAADGSRLELPGAGAAGCERRPARAAPRRLPRGRRDDAVLLAGHPRGVRRYARAAFRAGGGGPRGRVRRLVLLSIAALVVAGCGSQEKRAATTAAAPSPTQAKRARHVLAPVEVTVVDGDTNVRVTGARVRIGPQAARSNRNGVALLRLRRRAALV